MGSAQPCSLPRGPFRKLLHRNKAATHCYQPILRCKSAHTLVHISSFLVHFSQYGNHIRFFRHPHQEQVYYSCTSKYYSYVPPYPRALRLGYFYLKYGFGAAVCASPPGVCPRSSPLRTSTSDFLSLRHRPEACRAAGQLAHFTAASTCTFAGFDHRVLLCSTGTEWTEPSAMMYAEAFKWVLEDHPSVGCECRLSLSSAENLGLRYSCKGAPKDGVLIPT